MYLIQLIFLGCITLCNPKLLSFFFSTISKAWSWWHFILQQKILYAYWPNSVFSFIFCTSNLEDSNFYLELRGLVEIKGKGMMTTYFLLGGSTDNNDGNQPNDVIEKEDQQQSVENINGKDTNESNQKTNTKICHIL